jgi:hypothetical protein
MGNWMVMFRIGDGQPITMFNYANSENEAIGIVRSGYPDAVILGTAKGNEVKHEVRVTKPYWKNRRWLTVVAMNSAAGIFNMVNAGLSTMHISGPSSWIFLLALNCLMAGVCSAMVMDFWFNRKKWNG